MMSIFSYCPIKLCVCSIVFYFTISVTCMMTLLLYFVNTTIWLTSMLLNKGSRQFTQFVFPRHALKKTQWRVETSWCFSTLWFFFLYLRLHTLNNEGSFTISLQHLGACSVSRRFLSSEQCRAAARLRLQVWNIRHPSCKAAVQNVFGQSL